MLRPAVRTWITYCSTVSSRRFLAVEVTASMVKELRALSGAPLLDCKTALAQDSVQGSMSKAIDWLRARGLKKMAQAQRSATEGLIALYIPSHNEDGSHRATLVEVNCETDFVSRNEGFQRFAASVSRSIAQNIGNHQSDNVALSEYDILPLSLSLLPVSSNSTKSLQSQSVQQALGDIVSSMRYCASSCGLLCSDGTTAVCRA
jgi:hypothetical protein